MRMVEAAAAVAYVRTQSIDTSLGLDCGIRRTGYRRIGRDRREADKQEESEYRQIRSKSSGAETRGHYLGMTIKAGAAEAQRG